jgi:CBS domain-containing protein
MMTRELVTLDENEKLADANTLLGRRHIRHLPVVREGKLVGLITHRDILRCIATKGGGCRAGDLMTREVLTVNPQTPLLDAIRMMRNHSFGCLPVVEGERLVGILTEADLVRFAETTIERQDRKELAAEYR